LSNFKLNYWSIRQEFALQRKVRSLDLKLNFCCPFRLNAIDMTIYVGNLSYRATEEDLRAVFADYGTIKRIVLPMDKETGRMRGFAFVDMMEDAQEDAAITDLDGAEWMGRQLRVNKAKPREDNEGGGGYRRGGTGQRRASVE
jgi:RNA recognition motif-containing protein